MLSKIQYQTAYLSSVFSWIKAALLLPGAGPRTLRRMLYLCTALGTVFLLSGSLLGELFNTISGVALCQSKIGRTLGKLSLFAYIAYTRSMSLTAAVMQN
jgi:hypothetical protein